MSEFQRLGKDFHLDNDDSEDGAKILKILETAAEPDILMAEMSPQQLNSLSIYQAKLEVGSDILYLHVCEVRMRMFMVIGLF